ncbi:MAG: hypothetical protein ACXAC7_18125 [Candidatus Hodarchaeales archaeon]|jgi:hypothetical protein
MKASTNYEEAFNFLEQATRQYVTAKTMNDKLLAVRHVVVAIAIAIDAILTLYSIQTSTHDTYMESDVDIQLYKQHVNDLSLLEEIIPNEILEKLTHDSRQVLTVITQLQESKNPIAHILEINFKEFQQLGLNFLLTIKKLFLDHELENTT